MKILSTSSFLLLFAAVAFARWHPPNTSPELVSDGEAKSSENVIQLASAGGTSSSAPSPHEGCEQMYGILPCSETISGHVLLIVIYEYLLFHGESYVAAGGERIFKILGPGVFGACAFQLIGSLPEALILLASGLLNNNEVAQECVLTGVGLVAGSSILLLTLVWGTCVILSTQHFSNYFNSDPSSAPGCAQRNPIERFFLSLWPGYGMVTDFWTGYTARILLVSVIPFAFIQLPKLLGLSSSLERIFVVVTLIVTVALLLSYFFYQLFQPWIQRRQLLYLKHGHLVVDILNHVQNHTMENLFTKDGAPNTSVIRRIFEETDQDGDKYLTSAELKEFLREMKFRRLYSDKERATEDVMKEFDVDNDKRITSDEFVKGMEKWIDETQKDSGKPGRLNEVLQPWIEKKREEREMMKNIIPEILQALQASTHGRLLSEDGTPDIPAIKRLFRDIDNDQDDFISHSELKDLLMDVKYGTIPQDIDAAASNLMDALDVSGDHLLSEDEFITGLSTWLKTTSVHTPIPTEEPDYQEKWEQTDMLVEEKFVDKSFLAWTKAIALVVIGIVMLGLLAEPLIQSVRNLSKAANIPSFFIAFVFVPFATNARIASSAISEARRKKLNINSLTFSELYGTVLMNNLLGFSVLLSLIYFRGLSWEFSTEILAVLIVAAVMGCLASFSNIFPIWTALLAYLLYPLSLVLVNLGDFDWLS